MFGMELLHIMLMLAQQLFITNILVLKQWKQDVWGEKSFFNYSFHMHGMTITMLTIAQVFKESI